MRIVVGITGATGAILGVRLLQELQRAEVETHVVMSQWAASTLRLETDYRVEDVKRLATHWYAHHDQGAAISSGSYPVDGMVVAPCSMKTLAAIRVGLADNLITRAADVMLKERRKLVLLTRETPLSTVHLENMLALSQMGAVILPPMMAFYNHPGSVEAMVNHIVYRTLDQFGLYAEEANRWNGVVSAKEGRSHGLS
ncbi:MAG: UbiX family flavin prenyltransferase [Alicyclobacillus herbarius]|uniref:non-oxidative hydroxyarylic acid decarboxylases subunit B n=1 Tax=Alicyclobacillus herbarius TaxID=122960 RepID=UPI00040A73A4|nr:non-oxidative hydroxyarylic acid decarboxylases subunit B [Alicyclobacillus herbarius]MCL6631821.1 UbiX family flavin prenyltransferase [Alicyclobacillus herbarius]